MKGLLLSMAVFVAYAVSTALLSHTLRPRRHPPLFLAVLAAWTPMYFLAFMWTPSDLYILAPAWMAHPPWLDMAFGYAVLLLNAHSYMDYFFGFNSGFSTSIMQIVLGGGEEGVKTEDVVNAYISEDGVDKIHGWRMPQLAESGYVILDPARNTGRLTGKGRVLARITWILKRFLNLGAGG